MMGRLQNKVAIITGGASGIGAATMRRFAAEGAVVVGADLNDEAGARVVNEITAAGGRAAFHHADVSVLAEVEATVAFAVERFGGLDIMFNNAARTGGGYVADIDVDTWSTSLGIMLNGVFYGMKAAIPRMVERGGGSIVTTSSVEAFVGEIMAAPYNTAKAGVIALTKAVAREYGRKNIRANCICPGAVDTPMLDQLDSVIPNYKQEAAQTQAHGRLIRPDEIANVALFLASDDSSAITGAAIVADAGLTCALKTPSFPPFGT